MASVTRVAKDTEVLTDVAVGIDKIFTPVGRSYEIVAVRALVTTTATVGNRQLVVQIRDASNNVLYTEDAGSTVAASQTAVPFDIHWTGDPAVPPNAVVPPGGDLRIYDSAAVDVLDTFAVRGLVIETLELEV